MASMKTHGMLRSSKLLSFMTLSRVTRIQRNRCSLLRYKSNSSWRINSIDNRKSAQRKRMRSLSLMNNLAVKKMTVFLINFSRSLGAGPRPSPTRRNQAQIETSTKTEVLGTKVIDFSTLIYQNQSKLFHLNDLNTVLYFNIDFQKR